MCGLPGAREGDSGGWLPPPADCEDIAAGQN